MKAELSYGWNKGESWRLLPNVEIYNCPESLWISFAFCKWDVSLGLSPSNEEE